MNMKKIIYWLLLKKKITGKESGERKLSGGQISTTSNYDLDICYTTLRRELNISGFYL